MQAMLECCLASFRSGGFAAAIEQLNALVAAYADSPQAAEARSAVVAAEVAAATTDSASVPYAGDNPGRNPITLYNDSPREVRVLLAGPTAHEFTLPACADCPATYASREDACPTFEGRPSLTLNLRPGSYYLLADDPSDADITKLTDVVKISSGFSFTDCLHIETRSPYTPYSSPYSPYGSFPDRYGLDPDVLDQLTPLSLEPIPTR